jgi:DNA modification methylase
VERVDIGNATLYHADSRDVLPTIPHEYLVITDPPYGIGFKYDGDYADRGGDEYVNLISVLKGRDCVVLQYPEETMRYLIPVLGVPDKCVAWCYNSNTPRSFRLWSFWGIKPDFNAYKIPPKNPTDKRVQLLVRSYDWFDDIQQVKNVSEEKTDHPCQVSIEMMKRIISLACADPVVDPFMGSGSTGVATLNLGKRFIGIEKERKYFDIACSRIEAEQSQVRMFA